MNNLLLRRVCLGLVVGVMAVSAVRGADIGVSRREFTDSSRSNWAGTGPRQVRVTLWYARGSGGERELIESDGESIPVWRDARLLTEPERHPLILLSPGSGGDAGQVFWWGRALAAAGYVVMAFDHNGTNAEELGFKRPTLTDFLGWERAADLSSALTQLRADAVFGPKIDDDRIGAAGFSLGGTTALWVAGARLNLEKLRRESPPPPPGLATAIAERLAHAESDPMARAAVARAELSYRDQRIKAVFALAPPMGAGFPEDALREIRVPVCIAVGETDVIAPPEGNARHFAASIPGAHLTMLSGERGHYTTSIEPEQRRRELQEVATLSLEFFAQHLKAQSIETE